MGPALQHHYEDNCHHPEHYRNGIHDMNMVDLIEMLCDWRAAIKRYHPDGRNNFDALLASIENQPNASATADRWSISSRTRRPTCGRAR